MSHIALVSSDSRYTPQAIPSGGYPTPVSIIMEDHGPCQSKNAKTMLQKNPRGVSTTKAMGKEYVKQTRSGSMPMMVIQTF